MRLPTAVCRVTILSSLAACCAAGCSRKPPPAPLAPPVRAVMRHSLGSPVDLPAPGGAPGGDALVVTLRGYAADASSLPPGESLASRGQLIIDSVSEPMSTAPPAAEAVRLVADGSSLPAPKTGGKGAVAV